MSQTADNLAAQARRYLDYSMEELSFDSFAKASHYASLAVKTSIKFRKEVNRVKKKYKKRKRG